MATTLPPLKKPRREDVPLENLCEHCTAKCCRYFALQIDAPSEYQDYDYIRWYLLHDFATVFIDDGTWYLLVHTTCQHLQADYRCGIYETRPQICREYSTDNCEYDDDAVYDGYFESPQQVVEYVEAVLGNPDGRLRSPRPPLLPIMG